MRTFRSAGTSHVANFEHNWYAIRLRSNFEAMTSRALKERGFEEFAPTYKKRRKWSDRIQEIHVPLFPGYVFCRFDATHLLTVLNTPGVVHVVSAGTTPIPIDESEITAVRALCRSGLPTEPWNMTNGRKISIVDGPLRGTQGVVIKIKDSYRIVASISLLQRAICAELDPSWVAALN